MIKFLGRRKSSNHHQHNHCSILNLIYYANFVLSIIAAFICIIILTVKSHVCVLERRRDNTMDTERWSLPSEDRCYCTSVVAPKFISVSECAAAARERRVKTRWFIEEDDLKLLTNNSNWNAEKLDILLKRAEFCSKLLESFIILSWKKMSHHQNVVIDLRQIWYHPRHIQNKMC